MTMEEQTDFINYIKKHPIKTLFYIYGVALIAYQISKGLDFGESNSAQTSSSINTSAISESEPTPPAISASTFSIRYADSMTSNFSSSSICNNYKNMIYQMTEGNIPENIKIMKIDKIFDAAFKYHCVPY